MDFEQELPDRLRASVQTLQPDLATLAAASVVQGERTIRRHRVLRAVGVGGATLALLAGGGIYLATGGDDPAAGNPGTGLTVAGPPGKQQPAGKQKLAQITPQASLQLLLDELPAGARTGDYEGSSEFTDEKAAAKGDFSSRVSTEAQLTYTDAEGASQIAVRLDWSKAVPELLADCKVLRPAVDSCKARTRADGSTLVLFQSYTSAFAPAAGERRGPKFWAAWLIHPDGLQVAVAEVNATTDQVDAKVTRPEPPLSLGQLEAIVTSPSWRTELSAEKVKRAAGLFTAQEDK